MDSARIEQTAAEWLARRDGGNWSEHDQVRLDAWLDAATAHRVAWLRLDAAWRQADRLKALGAGLAPGTMPHRGQWTESKLAPAHAATTGEPGLDLEQLRFAPRQPARTARAPRYFGLAGMVLLAGVLGWAWFRYAPIEQALYTAATGELRNVTLSDGSRLTLSSGSRVAIGFSRARRKLDLEQGEAFFEVAKDASRPFVVVADARRVTAVGTRFAVRRDPAALRVVVTEGTVKLQAEDADGQPAHRDTLLPAGSIATAGPAGVLVRRAGIDDAERQLDWRSGFLSFSDTPLAEAAAEFNRYNTRKIVVADEATAALLVGGNFRWSNAEAFVRLIEQAFPVRAEADGERIVLRSR